MALVEGRQMATGGYVFPGRDARGRINKLTLRTTLSMLKI